jgi:hypothetical protein
MASTLNNVLRRPVRVLIRTHLEYLQKIDPSPDMADIKLIETFWAQLCNTTDATGICHLITKISDSKRSERVEIVFDYDVPATERQPRVVAFKVEYNDSLLSVRQLSHPLIQRMVNDTVLQ